MIPNVFRKKQIVKHLKVKR